MAAPKVGLTSMNRPRYLVVVYRLAFLVNSSSLISAPARCDCLKKTSNYRSGRRVIAYQFAE